MYIIIQMLVTEKIDALGQFDNCFSAEYTIIIEALR